MASVHRQTPTNGAVVDARFDVVLAGSVFFDIVFTDLHGVPSAGTEVWAEGMGSSGLSGHANRNWRRSDCESFSFRNLSRIENRR